MELKINSFKGKEVGALEVLDDVFGLVPRADILQRVIRWQLARRQQGMHHTQTRSDVSRTGSKMYKQKGTGRARHSSARVSQFRGGGKAHGSVLRQHAFSLPKKIRALGLKHALSSKVVSNNIIVVDSFDIKETKTKIFAQAIDKLGWTNALMIVPAEAAKNLSRLAGNIPNIDVLPVQGINVYDILRRNKLILSKEAVATLEERFK